MVLKSILTNLKTFTIILIIFLKVSVLIKNHLKKPQTIIIARINIFFVIINQINKHKAKIFDQRTYTLFIIKKL